MMLTLGDIFAGLTGMASLPTQVVPQKIQQHPIDEVVIDSRKAIPNAFFVALPGERVDGHDYVQAAFTAGAVAALISHPVAYEGLTIPADALSRGERLPQQWQLPLCIQTPESMVGLQKLAAYWRKKFTPNVIGITGSIGKSSTKELTYAVLAQKYRTLKNQGSLNNEIGLPLTLMALDTPHEQVVLEMGMYDLGEIKMLCQIARPHVGLVTNIGPSHLERLGTIERIALAKRELVEALTEDGVAILNLDDPLVAPMSGHTRGRVFTYGLSNEADLWADHLTSHGLEGIRVVFHYQGEDIPVSLPLLGRHNAYTALAAAAVGLTQGLAWPEIVAGLQDPTARLRLIAVPGPRNSLILDDTYNSSAASSIAALEVLHELKATRKIAVLGDMAELGSYEEEGHRQVGRRVAQVVDQLVTIGSKAKLIAQEATRSGLDQMASHCLDEPQAVRDYLTNIIQSGDIILIKGSRSLAMESIVKHLRTNVDIKSLHNESLAPQG